MQTDYLLYAAQPSYFSAKVRACLQYKRIPYTERGLGRVETTLGDVPLSRPAGAYTAWKLQRLIDAYCAVPEERCPEMDELLRVAGFLEVCRHRPLWRLEKRRISSTAPTADASCLFGIIYAIRSFPRRP